MKSSTIESSKVNAHRAPFTILKHDNWNGKKNPKRGRLDIIAAILYFCEKQKTKTSIMYNTNLNYSQLKKHITSLTKQGLLLKNYNKYVTSAKGRRFLQLFSELNSILEKA